MSDSSSAEFVRSTFFADGDKTQEVIFGNRICDELGERAKSFGTHAYLVTDSGLSKAGHPQRVCRILTSAGIKVTTYDQSKENPSDSSVQECAECAREAEIDLIIGLGGGSSMDTAKGCNFLVTNGGSMSDYWGINKTTHPMLPMIAIPTTAGTGSECQSFALITNDQTRAKMACGDKKALPRLTLLDPELTLSQPPLVSACTGLDALAHALESAVTLKRNEKSMRHSQIAFHLIKENLPKIFDCPNDLNARGKVLLGASHAGAAIERSMLGAAHSMANPLTARRETFHGMAVGLALPAVMDFNASDRTVRSIYSGLSRAAGIAQDGDDEMQATQRLISWVRFLLHKAGLLCSLGKLGFETEQIDELAADAADQWTASFNPKPIKISDFKNLYGKLFHEVSYEASFPLSN